MGKRSLAVVTMVYNEPDFLPIWLRFYSKEVGSENCFIINHGSDDGSIESVDPACSILNIPRSPHSDVERAELVSKFCASLLVCYDNVIYGDIDEIIVADNLLYAGLQDFCAKNRDQVITTIGMDILHDAAHEPALDWRNNIMAQRQWARPLGFLCKPALIHREVKWWSGFHGYDGQSVFSNLYLFHLALCDVELIRRRQAKRNRSAPIDGGGSHHLLSPDVAAAGPRNMLSGVPRILDADPIEGSPHREAFLDQLFDPERARGEQQIRNLTSNGGIWKIPERFKDVF